VRDVLQSDVLFDAIPAINEAFHQARVVSNSTSAVAQDFIERSEFRVFLVNLRQNFEYLQAYDR
jgi:hypothetical protein